MTTPGEEMHALVERMYPLCRSITGDGVRATLDIVGGHLPLEVHEVPTGTQVLDWTVPQEWNVREAWIADPSGRRVVDLADSSLHVLGYSVPVAARMPLSELRPHLHTLPEHPKWVPYRTSYYKPDWGSVSRRRPWTRCRTASTRCGSTPPSRTVTSPTPSTWCRGQVPDEVIVSSHVCHPSLANDNLAGIAVAVFPPGRSPGARRTTRTGSCSRPAPSGRSPGWPATPAGWSG